MQIYKLQLLLYNVTRRRTPCRFLNAKWRVLVALFLDVHEHNSSSYWLNGKKKEHSGTRSGAGCVRCREIVTNDGHAAKQCLSPAVMAEHGTARVRSTAIVIFIHYINAWKISRQISLTSINFTDLRITDSPRPHVICYHSTMWSQRHRTPWLPEFRKPPG